MPHISARFLVESKLPYNSSSVVFLFPLQAQAEETKDIFKPIDAMSFTGSLSVPRAARKGWACFICNGNRIR